ncbi:MAG: cytochrome c3 family protein [Deltaproteobacteria bacterium]|nr:cytochrome c3 family protein [Deltaproteobacteria bacterium]
MTSNPVRLVVGKGCRMAEVFVVVFLVMLIEIRSVRAEDPAVNPHSPEVAGYCGVCHAAKMPELLHDSVTTCVKCHETNITNHPVTRHPIGKTVRINVPSPLPLTKDRKIVCTTCHEPHGQTDYPKMLRAEYDGFCIRCHVGY